MFGPRDTPSPGPVEWIELEPTSPDGAPRTAPVPASLHWESPPRTAAPTMHTVDMLRYVARPLEWLGARLIAPPGEDLRRWHSTDVTCRIRRSATDAVEALGRTGDVEWGQGRHPSRLTIQRVRQHRSALPGPRLADAVVQGQRTGVLQLTIAIFEGHGDSCVVQLRRTGRSTWGLRRRRRCMTATHDAADRLVEQILAVDFRPPPPRTTT